MEFATFVANESLFGDPTVEVHVASLFVGGLFAVVFKGNQRQPLILRRGRGGGGSPLGDKPMLSFQG